MRSHKSVKGVVVLSFLAAAGVARAQDIPGYTLQETVLVPVTGATVSSQSSLAQGVRYKLRAVGRATVSIPGPQSGLYQRGDAEYGFDRAGSPFLPNQISNCLGSPDGVDVGLAVNDAGNGSRKAPFWGAYNPAHVYTVDFTGLGAPINVSYHDCTFTGNDGLLTVEIFRPMGMTLPAAGPPTITDVSPGINTFSAQMEPRSVSGRVNALAAAPDGKRLYAGTFAGVWRSDDAGLTWRQMTRPQPTQGAGTVAGALFEPDVFDLAISPSDPDVVMAGVGAGGTDLFLSAINGVYRSEDGGNNWTLVKKFNCSKGGRVTQIVFAPDDPKLVFAAGGCAIAISGDGGKTWREIPMPAGDAAWHVAVAPFEPPVSTPGAAATGPLRVRRVYALGTNQMFYSIDGGQSWLQDSGLDTIVARAKVGGGPDRDGGNSSRILMIEPGQTQRVLVAVNSLANGPRYYKKHECGLPDDQPEVDDGKTCNADGGGCGEASLWLGDFKGFVPADPTRHAATWSQLPGPPVYFGETTPSGNAYVNVQRVGNSDLIFFSDRSHVHVSAGLPTAGGWHRMEGLDASQTAPPHPPNPYCNHLFMHFDPHAMAMTPDLNLTLQAPAGSPAPYDRNKVAGPVSGGDLWLANDGGVYHAKAPFARWQAAGGLSTLAAINIAGLAIQGRAPALYLGTGDNDDFYSTDGGGSWKDPQSKCGDCDPWFADPAQAHQVMTFGGRLPGGGLLVFSSPSGYPEVEPNPPNGTVHRQWVCPADCNAVSSYSIRGYRPMVLTPPGTKAPATGDFLIIGTRSDGTRALFRKTNGNPIDTPQDWENPSKARQYGPPLPPCGSAPADCIDVVQASGGHKGPVVYVGDPSAGPNDGGRPHTMTLWKWAPGMSDWQQIVPSPASTPTEKAAKHAWRFYVDPFNPNLIYLLDDNAIKRSDDGGATWGLDVSLDDAVTEGHRYEYTADFAVIKDMVFVRGEKNTRFAVGNAGVFYTLNGTTWLRLLSTRALPGHPVSAYFDDVSDPCDRALYVGFDGRGILRIDPIPAPGSLGTGGSRPCTDGSVSVP